MGRLFALLAKDTKVILRSRTLLVTLILYPLLMVAILGLVFADPEQKVPISLVVSPTGNDDVELGDRVFSLDDIAERIERVARVDMHRPDTQQGYTDALDEAREDLRNGDVDAVVVFPDHFLRDLLFDFEKQVDLTVILDRSDPAKSTIAESAVRASIQRFNEEVVEYKVDVVVDELNVALEGDPQIPDAIGFRDLRQNLVRARDDPGISDANRRRINESIAFVDVAIGALEDARPTLRSIALPIRAQVTHIDSGVLFQRDIVVPATVALSVFWTGILAASSLTVVERQSHAQLRLNVSPVGMHTIVLSKLLLTTAILLAQSLVIVLIAKGLWDIRLDNPLLLVVMVAASAFSAVGIGLFIAGLSRDTNGSTLLSVLLVFPMMFLSGLFFPVSFMPPVAQALARMLPLTYAVDGLRGAMLKDYTFAHATLDLVFLIGLGTIAMVIGYVRNKRLARTA